MKHTTPRELAANEAETRQENETPGEKVGNFFKKIDNFLVERCMKEVEGKEDPEKEAKWLGHKWAARATFMGGATVLLLATAKPELQQAAAITASLGIGSVGNASTYYEAASRIKEEKNENT